MSGQGFGPHTFSADEGAAWTSPGHGSLRMNEHFIAGPGDGKSRETWLRDLRAYRESVGEAKSAELIRLTFDGIRAWVRMDETVARAYALRPGDRVEVRAEARWLEGNNTLCVAFDRHDGTRGGWTGVVETMDVPTDGGWHEVRTQVTVPEFPHDAEWLRPILGMDATFDSTRGTMELRGLRWVVDDDVRMNAVDALLASSTPQGLDRSIYDRADLAWMAEAFTCHFTFMYDRSFYNPEQGRYTVDAFLDDGEREFGTYDAMVLWQGYPRLGVDQRNQFDMYRDMPGGLEGIRDAVRRAHERGVKVFIDYNPWDTGTRREAASDEAALAELVAAIEADGIFLDTMSAAAPSLRTHIDVARPGVVFAPEGHPAIDQLSMCNGSWAQWLHDPEPPGMLHLKWIEPRHMQHQIRRWDRSHVDEIATAFFNGSGMLVWENVFGTYNPWPDSDRNLWKRASTILRAFPGSFASDRWDPFYPTLVPELCAHRWPGADVTLYTLRNTGEPLRKTPLLALPWEDGAVYVDVWNEKPVEYTVRSDSAYLVGDIDRIGCIAVASRDAAGRFRGLFDSIRGLGDMDTRRTVRNVAHPVIFPKPVPKAAPAGPGIPPGMVLIPQISFSMQITHQRRECGCYPDPGTPEEGWRDHLWGSPWDGTITHTIGPVDVGPFFIDEAEVTNAEYKRFLEESGYTPRHRENFLKHWNEGVMPEELADHPVVYVDLDDARAFARWAGKRLPTEAEWQLAAQGPDGRTWPWGAEFDPAKCNTTGDRTLPVRSLPEGRSPLGCYQMAGNVWEWTESERDDGHTRFAMIRGGSYFDARTSGWYVAGGPQPCNSHAKFLLMWPGLDRCATVGFRCVMDAP